MSRDLPNFQKKTFSLVPSRALRPYFNLVYLTTFFGISKILKSASKSIFLIMEIRFNWYHEHKTNREEQTKRGREKPRNKNLAGHSNILVFFVLILLVVYDAGASCCVWLCFGICSFVAMRRIMYWREKHWVLLWFCSGFSQNPKQWVHKFNDQHLLILPVSY